MTYLRRTLALCAVCVIGLVAGSVAAASPSEPPCTWGDAEAIFEAPYPGHLIGSLGVCQYRVWMDGETFTFCQDDFIVGGNVYSWAYLDDGVTRAEAIAYLELFEDQVWIDGVEMPLTYTAWKNGRYPRTGEMVVYQHQAFITKLAVGQHTSYYESFHPVEGPFTATVDLLVLPRTDPACS